MGSETSRARVVALWVLGLATIAGFVAFHIWDQKMADAGGPGIARFEFVIDRNTAAWILTAWGKEGQDAARTSLWFDFFFIVIYTSFLVLAIRTAAAALARRGMEQLAWMGGWIWIFAIAGGLFDVLEDIGLLLVLRGTESALLLTLGAYCTVLKFALLMGAVLYLIVASIALVRARRQKAPRPGEEAKRPSPQH
jgi:hypothetical protein